MLPFVRMFEYGNVAPHGSPIKKVQSGTSHWVVLKENGDLYGLGANSDNQLPITKSSILYNLELVASDIKDVWCGDLCTLMYTKTGKWIYCGQLDPLGTNSTQGAKSALGGEEIPDFFDYNSVKDISISYYSLHVLDTTGRIYARGFNNNGTVGVGSNTRIPSFVRVDSTSDFLSIRATPNSFFAVSSENKLYGNGRSSYGEMSKVAGVYYTFSMLNTGVAAIGGNPMTSIIQSSSSVLMLSAGNQYEGQCADNVTTNTSKTVWGPCMTPSTFSTPYIMGGKSNSYVNIIYNPAYNLFYSAGHFNLNGQNGTSKPTFTIIDSIPYDVPVDVNKLHMVSAGVYAIIFTGKEVWGTGNSAYLPGKKSDNSDKLIYTKLTIPE